jgi:hypothetical protein
MIMCIKIYIKLLFFFGSIALPLVISAQVPKHAVEKIVIKKIYVGKSTSLNIDNQYGDVVIKYNRHKNVLIKVILTGESDNLSRADSIVKQVKITTRTEGKVIKVKTVLDGPLTSRIEAPARLNINGSYVYIQYGVHDQCHISYHVFIPQGLKLKVSNSYGNVDAGTFTGDLDIDEKFGDVLGARLSGSFKINLEQGNLTCDSVNNGDITVKGFQSIRIATLTGIIRGNFSAGGQVDMGLSNGLKGLNLNADNVKPINIVNLKTVCADLLVHTLLSGFKTNNMVHLPVGKGGLKTLNDTTGVQVIGINKDSSNHEPDSLPKKGKKIFLIGLKKEMDYEFKSGNAEIPITIRVSFCQLNLKD